MLDSNGILKNYSFRKKASVSPSDSDRAFLGGGTEKQTKHRRVRKIHFIS